MTNESWRKYSVESDEPSEDFDPERAEQIIAESGSPEIQAALEDAKEQNVKILPRILYMALQAIDSLNQTRTRK